MKHRSLGLRPGRTGDAILFAVLIAILRIKTRPLAQALWFPIANVEWDLGIWYIPFTVFVIMALTNSVNLTDRLDGLAGGVTLINTATYCLIFLGLLATNVWAKDMMIFAGAVTGGIWRFSAL